jgi:hypothetical protein
MNSPFLTNPSEIIKLLSDLGIENYTLFPNKGSIGYTANIHQNVNLDGKLTEYDHLPIQFGVIEPVILTL